jgi:hypothetical protein
MAVELFHSLHHRILQMSLQQCLLLRPQRWNTNTHRLLPSHPLLGLPLPPPLILLLLLLLLFPPAPCSSLCSRRCRKGNSLTTTREQPHQLQQPEQLQQPRTTTPPPPAAVEPPSPSAKRRLCDEVGAIHAARLFCCLRLQCYKRTRIRKLHPRSAFGSLTPPPPPHPILPTLRPDCAARTC